MEYTRQIIPMTQINRIKKVDNGSMTTGTMPIGKGRLKENFKVLTVSKI